MPEHFLHMPEHAQTCLYKPVHACTTEELPSQKRKPLCDRYLYRWIRPSFPFWSGRGRDVAYGRNSKGDKITANDKPARDGVAGFQFSVFSFQQKGELHLCVLCVLGGSILFFFLCAFAALRLCAGTSKRNQPPGNK